ncbi:MAG TPA: teichoic acid ABC transporter permease [Lachnospiraceae bacterium]|jgi:teichoic acid transport system permease protein|nr:teichoic acid ABC transporter permease [Lachnospiraceae bacterium]HCE74952.1 teichoic acid ABC transporter permease [Lachnospiraceae bacterium]HCG60706.1 teichoic acid ABC transporter permease [Lachnospiraceae bacterium]HCI84537.1 teichoic acid ABC transporter permease [Lachnospiraceae bacterium]
MLKYLITERKLIVTLAKNDFRKKFAGSYMGILWALVQPVVTVLMYWFVFQVGLRQTQSYGGVPFILWMLAGLVPWFYFNDALTGGTSSLVEYSYLVKKVVFRIEILPIVKACSALYVHVFFVVLTYVLYCLYGKFPGWYSFQLLYYSVCMFILVLSLSYGTAAISVLFRDNVQIVAIALQVGVWFTPIMWNFADIAPHLPKVVCWIFKLNPMYYICYGYRDSLIGHVPFWHHPLLTAWFWMFTILAYLWGTKTFRRSRGHFADVL